MNNTNNEKLDPKGVVYVYVNDELVSVNHNMIVNTGRLFLLDKLYSALGNDDTEAEFKDYKFYKAYFGATRINNIVTKLETTLGEVKEADNIVLEFDLKTSATVNRITKSIRFLFEVNIPDAKQNNIGEIYLTISDQANDEETLFSRVLIDPLFLDASESQKIEYYVYF